VTVLMLLVIAAAAGLLALLIWLQVREDPSPEVQPGLFRDPADSIRFALPEGWDVVHDGPRTRVEHTAGVSPAFWLEVRSIEQVDLVVNWQCLTLVDRAPLMAQAAAPWPVTVVHFEVPCVDDPALPAYVQAYLALADDSGQLAVMVLGPLDGLHWIVVRTDPFTGDWPEPVVAAMTEAVVSVRRNQ